VKWRKFIPPEFQDEICPEPNKGIIQRIKNEENEKLKLKVKQLAAKKEKKIKQQLIIATESELVLENV
jgi:hypothetical protein